MLASAAHNNSAQRHTRSRWFLLIFQPQKSKNRLQTLASYRKILSPTKWLHPQLWLAITKRLFHAITTYHGAFFWLDDWIPDFPRKTMPFSLIHFLLLFESQECQCDRSLTDIVCTCFLHCFINCLHKMSGMVATKMTFSNTISVFSGKLQVLVSFWQLNKSRWNR